VPLSPALCAVAFVSVSGQVLVSEDRAIVRGRIGPETDPVRASLAKTLALTGCMLLDIVKTTV